MVLGTSNQIWEVDMMNRYFNRPIAPNDAPVTGEISSDDTTTLQPLQEFTTDCTKMITSSPNRSLSPSEYFTVASPHVSTLLVSPQNFSDIQTIANSYPSGLTDFLGFECRLNGDESQTDWALAISGKGDARYILADFLNNGYLPQSSKQTYEWQQIQKFSKMWTDSNSILHNKIVGAWLEFDMPDSLPEVLVPSVFFNPANINGITAHDPAQYEWFTKKAIPILIGRRLSKTIELNLRACIQKMPRKASLFIVGVMLSRKTSDIRMSVLFRDSRQIMSYLDEIGWSDDETETFASLIKELDAKKVNRMVLDFDVGKQIGKKIAVECSFYPNHHHKEEYWKELLDFLVEKGFVTPEKRDELLRFPGKEQEHSSIVRYITHVKIVYEPGKPIKAKAYLAIRHFLDAATTMMKN